MDTTVPVPAHLRRYVVEQNYAAYTSRDQAVWRFVLKQTHARLLKLAHPAYAKGFAAAGIEVDRIPQIARMGDSFFRTVCVDGFIPPRAFQAFQARGVLPIAADIRSAEHLTYTPAPDIIHEAAGHAPFLADADYARFLRRIGEVSERAFESAHDRRLYDAIHLLSELKEDPASTAEQVRLAEERLARVKAQSSEVSQATRMARLYWWTVEYGLVGTLRDFRLYGAGLLSSIGEAHFCQEPSVEKRWLDASCVEQDYDITRSQPQLFVVRGFAELEGVLDEVARGLGRGDVLAEARRSEDVATLTLPSGLAISGIVRDFSREHVELRGPCRVSRAGHVIDSLPATDGYWLALAGTALQLEGERDGDVMRNCVVRYRGQVVQRAESYPLLAASHVRSVSAAVPEGFYPATPLAGTQVPKQRTYDVTARELITMHERVSELMRARLGASALAPLHRALAAYPDEWLLRWNLLEALITAGEGREKLALTLADELERLEIRYAHREPIATGLAQLRGHAT